MIGVYVLWSLGSAGCCKRLVDSPHTAFEVEKESSYIVKSVGGAGGRSVGAVSCTLTAFHCIDCWTCVFSYSSLCNTKAMSKDMHCFYI